ncbi:MAG TPA: hypothetical protein VK503_02915, partial [Candidatus Bathyarchaeia archaeon]|nr:hypothetical protein [Candidatus Bathyarchaeia archaeon]
MIIPRGAAMHSEVNEMNPFIERNDFLTINAKMHLAFDGLDTIALAQKYGTPLYVVSENRIRENFRKWFSIFQFEYPKTRIFYALKANSLLAVCAILNQ